MFSPELRRWVSRILVASTIGVSLLPIFAEPASACGDPNNPKCENYQGYRTTITSNPRRIDFATSGSIPLSGGNIGFGIKMFIPTESKDLFWTSYWNGSSRRVWLKHDSGDWAGEGTCFFVADAAKTQGATSHCKGSLYKVN